MAMTSQELTQWAEGYLASLGAPASGADDPRVKFLIAWGAHEATNATNNPLAITKAFGVKATNLAGNSAGVKQFKTAQDGYTALTNYFERQGITNLIGELKNPQTSILSLTSALSAAHWEGSATPAAMQASTNYANQIGSAAMGVTYQPQPLNRTTSTSAPVNLASVGSSPTKVTTPMPIPGAFGADMMKSYAGPGAYKGFDLSAIPASLRAQAESAINYFVANPQIEHQMLQSIYQSYGNMAWAASDPQIRTLMVAGTFNNWAADKALAQSLIADTTWYKTHNDSQRMWSQISAVDPGEARKAISQAASEIIDVASKLGVQLTQAQVDSMANYVAPLSVSVGGNYVNTTEIQQQITQMVTAQFNANKFLEASGLGSGTPGATTPATAANAANAAGTGTTGALSTPVTSTTAGGTASELYNSFNTIARNYLLNLTPQQIAGYVQQFLSTDTGQGFDPTTAAAGFTTIAQAKAKQMYPALASVIGTTTSVGTDNSPWAATDWVRNMIAQYTGLGSGDNVDLTSPQWSWILSGTKPQSNRAAGILSPGASGVGNEAGTQPTGQLPSADQLQTYLMGTPQFQTTHMAKSMAWGVGNSILKAFGYN